MTDANDNLRALGLWADAARARGLPVPPLDRLVLISREPEGWRSTTMEGTEPAWADTIDHLLTQVDLGVLPEAAVANLPFALRDPGTLPSVPAGRLEPDAAEKNTAVDPVTAATDALIVWRSARVAEGVDGAETIKDATLRNLVKYHQTTEEQVRKRLPGAAAGLAADLAARLASLLGGQATGASAAGVSGAQVAGAPETGPPAVGGRRAARRAAEAEYSPRPESLVTQTGRPRPEHTAKPEYAAKPEYPAESGYPSRLDAAADAVRSDRLDLGHADFCVYDYPETDVVPGAVTVTPTADAVRLSWEPWPAEPGETVLYRVVSGDDQAPYKPESGEPVAVVRTTNVEDHRFLVSAVRVYQVWVHVGDDEREARAAQPVKWAHGEDISPVDAMTLTEDEGRVIGQWSVFPGTQAVRVYRIPLDGAGGPRVEPRFQICADGPNLTGFVDVDVPRGRRYLYRVFAEVVVDQSVRLSRHRQQEILVSVRLQPITDLRVTISENNAQFDLAWTAPETGQTVRVYRFSALPRAGMEREDLDEAQLSPQGFTEEARIKHPITALDHQTQQMTGVPWPHGWDRAYLTPVTVAGGRVRIGTTAVRARPLPAVESPRLIERVDTEVVTFGWPAGAAAVRAYVGHPTGTVEQACQGSPFAEISASRYRRDGALTFPRPLPANGCAVYLMPVAYSGGEQILGEATMLGYPGLTRVDYTFQRVRVDDPKRLIVRLALRSPGFVEDLPPLVIVNNRQRFPLESGDGRSHNFLAPDGRTVSHCQIGRPIEGYVVTDWYVELTGVQGYIRMFVYGDQYSGRVALRDPRIEQLWLPVAGGPQR